MSEYTFKDVIIDPNDPRVEIGAEYYFSLGAQACIDYANSDRRRNTLERVDKSGDYHPFMVDEKDYPFIIRKKEPEKKYAPFDLSKPEARNRLRGKFLIQLQVGNFAPEERLVVGFSENTAVIGGHDPGCYNGHELLENFTFLDGTPCGEEIPV